MVNSHQPRSDVHAHLSAQRHSAALLMQARHDPASAKFSPASFFLTCMVQGGTWQMPHASPLHCEL